LDYIGHFYNSVESGMSIYLQLLVCFSIPRVVIVVYGHIKRSGYYDVDDLQVVNRRQRGGIYWYKGGLNPRTLTLWSIAAVVGMLFSVNDAYTGPFAPMIASGLVALIGCPIIHRFFPDKPEVYGPPRIEVPGPSMTEPAGAAENR